MWNIRIQNDEGAEMERRIWWSPLFKMKLKLNEWLTLSEEESKTED